MIETILQPRALQRSWRKTTLIYLLKMMPAAPPHPHLTLLLHRSHCLLSACLQVKINVNDFHQHRRKKQHLPTNLRKAFPLLHQGNPLQVYCPRAHHQHHQEVCAILQILCHYFSHERDKLFDAQSLPKEMNHMNRRSQMFTSLYTLIQNKP